MAKQGPLSGQQVANKYRLGELLGSGGMGAVYKAHDIRLNRSVAAKVMSPVGPISTADLQDYTLLFRAEALRLANLKHSGIPHIYDHFEEATSWFLVMEFIEGETLKDYLERRGGRLPVDEVLKIGIQLADVLHYLHTPQLNKPPIIFRDLKPANVMIAPDGQIFLIDFGIARLFTPGKSHDTFVAHSPGYAAPEQYPPHMQTTPQSDMYSLGATLHHLLSGVHPATTASPALLSIQQLPQLATLIAHMVAIDAAHRPASMVEVKVALQRMIDRTAVPAPTTPVPPEFFPATQPAQPGMGTASLAGTQPALAGSSSRSPFPPPGRSTPVAIDTPLRGTTLVTHKHSTLLGEYKYGVNALVWSPDGQRIASAGGGIDVWDTITGKTLKKLNGSPDAIVWSPDGKYIVASRGVGYDDRSTSHTTIWEASGSFWNRKQEEASYYYSDAAAVIVWSPDLSKVAIVGSPDFNPLEGELGVGVVSLRGHKLICRGRPCNGDAIAWSPDSTRIAWGARNEIPVWDARSSRQEGHHLLTYREHRSPIVAVSWSPDGRQITSRSEDGSGLVWDAGSGRTVATFTAPTEEKRRLVSLVITTRERSAISPDGILTAVATDDGVELRTVARGDTVFVYRGHFSDKTSQYWSPKVHALSWSPDGIRIAFARFDGRIYVWQAI
ncbi:MAG TPA: serine/threonine-protein kinase [Ktedonobacteraceae bacterium]|nr:serine/threonine-protein kinase [Ktedonobacteraceae bacterium]